MSHFAYRTCYVSFEQMTAAQYSPQKIDYVYEYDILGENFFILTNINTIIRVISPHMGIRSAIYYRETKLKVSETDKHN